MPSSHFFPISNSVAHNKTEGGYRIKATQKNFPALHGMSLYKLVLHSLGVREPHWHVNADELGYCLKGKVLVSLFGTGNLKQTFLVKTGEAFFIPSGFLHHIENIAEENAELILQFSHEEPEEFGLSSAMGMFSDAVLGNTWGVSEKVFNSLRRSTQDVFASCRSSPARMGKDMHYPSAYHYDLEGSFPLVANEGGSAKVARKNTWPILRRQALYSLKLTDKGMREPHWHPETAELGYVKSGKGRMSVLSPNGAVDTYEMQEGDIYFIPKAYPHHIENLSSCLEIAIFFDQVMPADIGFSASIKSFSDEVLASTMHCKSDFFNALPTYYEDLFIVDKINP